MKIDGFEVCPCMGYCKGNFCCSDMICSCYRGEKNERKPNGTGQYDKVLRKQVMMRR